MEDDLSLLQAGLNRVTDTCIPVDVMFELPEALLQRWQAATASGQRCFQRSTFVS